MSTLWQRNWNEEVANKIFEWRFGDLDEGETVFACDGDRPVAMIASSQRSYIMDHKNVRVREASDWFCLPEFRHLGLGVRIMQKLMDEPEPLLAIGGTEDAQGVLRAMGWRRLPDVRSYLLPLSTKLLASKVWHWLCRSRSCADTARSLERASNRWPSLCPGRSRSLSWHHLAPSEALPSVTPEAATYDLTPLVSEREVNWLRAAPKEMGTFFCLVFAENTRPAGFAIGRLFSHESLNYARLIHMQASSPSVEMYASMLAETIHYACDQGAEVAQLRASCPFLTRALKKFWLSRSVPAPTYWWMKNGTSPGNRSHLTFLRGDDGILPYPL